MCVGDAGEEGEPILDWFRLMSLRQMACDNVYTILHPGTESNGTDSNDVIELHPIPQPEKAIGPKTLTCNLIHIISTGNKRIILIIGACKVRAMLHVICRVVE